MRDEIRYMYIYYKLVLKAVQKKNIELISINPPPPKKNARRQKI